MIIARCATVLRPTDMMPPARNLRRYLLPVSGARAALPASRTTLKLVIVLVAVAALVAGVVLGYMFAAHVEVLP